MKRALGAVATLFALGLSGCPNPLGYTTPRTVAPGEVVQIPSLEVYDLRVGDSSLLAPSAPSYQVRLGVVERVDAGLRLSNFSGLGLDLKYNFFQSDTLDLALDPSVHRLGVVALLFWGDPELRDDPPADAFSFDVPLLAGFNLNPELSLVLRGGFLLVTEASDSEESYDWLPEGTPWRVLHGGAGVDVRLTPSFAVHPAFSVLVDATNGEIRGFVGGIGLALGRLPRFRGQSL